MGEINIASWLTIFGYVFSGGITVGLAVLTLLARRRPERISAEHTAVQTLRDLTDELRTWVVDLKGRVNQLEEEASRLRAHVMELENVNSGLVQRGCRMGEDLDRMRKRWVTLSAWLRRCAPELVKSAPEDCLAPIGDEVDVK